MAPLRTLWPAATRIRHFERASITRNANHDLIGFNTSFSDHDKGAMCLCRIDVRPKTVSSGTAWACPRISDVPLACDREHMLLA